jgi:nucleoside-diphosphate-sugar epimerase
MISEETSMETKRILITGGSGFIGSHLVKKFAASGQDAVIYDLQEQSPEFISNNYMKADIFDFKKLVEELSKSQVIIHLVGLADAGMAQRDPMRSFQLNVVSLQNVLEACRVSGGNKKLIFPSSAAVYGITEDLPIKESHPLNPTNIYSWHKYLGERMIRAYHTNFGINYVILRLFNVYGRGNKGVIDAFLEKAKRGEVIESFGPYQYRDFVYAGDVAEAFYRSAIYEKARNRVVNIGSGRGTQIREILDLICELYPRAKWVEIKKEFTMYDSIADTTLARILLDLEPHASREFMRKVIVEEMI